MAKLTLDALRKLREEQQKTMVKRDPSNKDCLLYTSDAADE